MEKIDKKISEAALNKSGVTDCFNAGAKWALSHQWYNAKDKRPDHLQPCLCCNKFVGAVRVYVYDDISKYWCDQCTSEHDVNGYNHITDYADYDVTHWMPIPPLPGARREREEWTLIGADDLAKDMKECQDKFPYTHTTMEEIKTSLIDRAQYPVDCVFGIEVSSISPHMGYTFEVSIKEGMTYVKYLGIRTTNESVD